MNAKDVIRSSMGLGLVVLDKYTSDLADEDLLRRPAPGSNCLAWQLGHLIDAECGLVNAISPGAGGQLPEGFSEAHSRKNAASDEASQFLSRQEYMDLYAKVRESTLAALDALPVEMLEAPGPERMRSVFPRVVDVFNLISSHPLMHAGQFAVVRRQLGKPIVI